MEIEAQPPGGVTNSHISSTTLIRKIMTAIYIKALLSLSLIGLVQARSAAAQAESPWDAVVTSE